MIGQNKIRLFVNNLIQKDNIPTEINLLLTGKAGIGKTYALKYIYLNLSKLPGLSDCIEHYPEVIYTRLLNKYKNIPIHIIDEVHRVKQFEILYPFMENHLFLSATNIPEDIPEAFRSRCINLVMENYSKKELGKIVKEEYNFSSSTIIDLVRRSRGTPRDILQMASIVNINADTDLEELGYYRGGYRREDMIYLDYMKKVGSASLARISASTNLDRTLIQTTIEPFLIERGHISITNRRYLND